MRRCCSTSNRCSRAPVTTRAQSAIASTLYAIYFLGCAPRPPETPETPETIPSPTDLGASAAAANFSDKVERHRELGIANRVGRAISRDTPGASGRQTVYHFPGLGTPEGTIPLMGKLQRKWQSSGERNSWMPWGEFSSGGLATPGPFMGAYRAKDFQLTLWIDQFAQDLFICYQDMPPLPEPELSSEEETP